MFKKLFCALAVFPTVSMAQSYVVYDFTHDRILESRAPNNVQPIASVTRIRIALPLFLMQILITSRAQGQNYQNTPLFRVMNC